MSRLRLVIGNKNYSSWSLRAWIFLRHHQLDFEEKRVPLFTDTTAAALAGYGSDYKVPALKDGELVIWDSLSILEYVSEVYLDNKGWPENPQARAIARSVSAEMHSSFFNIRNELPMNCRRRFDNVKVSADAEREIERIKSLWRKCREEYGGTGEWLFGEYTIADAMFAPIVLRFTGYGIPLSGVESAYAESHLQHPGIVEWVESGKLETEIIDAVEIS